MAARQPLPELSGRVVLGFDPAGSEFADHTVAVVARDGTPGEREALGEVSREKIENERARRVLADALTDHDPMSVEVSVARAAFTRSCVALALAEARSSGVMSGSANDVATSLGLRFKSARVK